MSIKKIVILLVLPPLAAAVCRGERYGGEFLNIAVGARAQGLGGAFGPAADDASAAYWNPAALSRVPGYELMAGHTSLFEGLAGHDFLAAAGPVSPKLWLGLAWVRLGVDGIPRFSHTVGTPPQGEFSDNENAVFASAASKRQFRLAGRPFCLGAGGSLKLIYDRLDNHQATGLGMDAGLLANVRLADLAASPPPGGLGEAFVSSRHPYLGSFSLSAVLTDVGGTAISWDTPRQHRDVRTAAFRFGASYRQPIAFMRSSLLASWEASTEPFQKSRAGAELELYRRLFLRAGSDNGQAVWGGGAAVWRMRLDYAFVGHDLGNTHRVSIAIKL
jgi:hypothetical protein